MDLVPNHTSSAHPWFQAALAAGPGSDPRERYIFRDGSAPAACTPPNNWVSVFGGPAWTRVVEPDGNPGQWYLHLFDAEQPDLNWDNPEVFDDLEKTLRFWLERGVDGFRIDVAHGMAKPPGLPDMKVIDVEVLQPTATTTRASTTTACTTSTAGSARCSTTTRTRSRSARCGCTTTSSSPSICAPTNCTWASISGCCEPNSTPPTSARRSRTRWRRRRIEDATPTWTLSNHDVDREVTRYGGGAIGLARARAMAMVMLALPGAVFIYNGEELGLPNVDLPDEALQDPMWERSGHTRRGRDACRVPDAVGGRRAAVRLLGRIPTPGCRCRRSGRR